MFFQSNPTRVESTVYSPMVITRTSSGERAMDIYSRLLEERIVFLNSGVDDAVAQTIVAQLMLLNSTGSEPISMYINSPGGSVHAGLAIHDVMKFIKAPVHTFVYGMAASMGSFLANAGETGHRYLLPESTTMIHRVSSGTPGTNGSMYVQQEQRGDIEASWAHTELLNKRLTELYSKYNTKGKTFEEFTKAMRNDKYLTAEEAVEFGLADQIIDKLP